MDQSGGLANPLLMRFALTLLAALSTLAFAGGAFAEPTVAAVTPVETALTPAAKAAPRPLASIFRIGKKAARPDARTAPAREAVITAPPAEDFIMQMPISLKRVRPPRGLG